MSTLLSRLAALIKKELLILFRDPKVRIVLIAPPLIQLFVFSFAATLEVKNVSLAVYLRDNGKHAQELVHRLHGSTTFSNLLFVHSPQELRTLVDEQKVLAAISIAADFSRHVEQGQPGVVQFVFDGRRSNAAQIVNGYLTNIVTAYGQELQQKNTQAPPRTVVVERNWFNENLLYFWTTVIALVGVLAMLITLMVTALSVAREKEMGTFDQLLVSPLMPNEILMGKTIPAVIVGFGEAFLIFAVGIFFFKIPFVGSVGLLAVSILVFIFSMVGVGLFISSLAKTQQQAILGAAVFMVPGITLSGFATPVENMPHWLQQAVFLNPLKHELIILKGLFLKDMPMGEVWVNLWPQLLVGTAMLMLAGRFFARKLG